MPVTENGFTTSGTSISVWPHDDGRMVVEPGTAIIVSDQSLRRMTPGEAADLEAYVKKTITDAGYDWTFERDESRRETRIIPTIKGDS